MGSFLCLVEPVVLRLVTLLVLWWTADHTYLMSAFCFIPPFGFLHKPLKLTDWSPDLLNIKTACSSFLTVWLLYYLKFTIYFTWIRLACFVFISWTDQFAEQKAYRSDAAVCYVCSAMWYWIILTRIMYLEFTVAASASNMFIRDVTLCSLIDQTRFQKKLLHPQLLVPVA